MSEAAWGPGGESLRGCFPAHADLRCGLSGQPSSPTLEAKRRAIMSSTIFSTGRPPNRMVKRLSSRRDTVDVPVLFSHQSRRRIGGGPLRPFVPTNGRRMCLCHSANAGTPEEKPRGSHAGPRSSLQKRLHKFKNPARLGGVAPSWNRPQSKTPGGQGQSASEACTFAVGAMPGLLAEALQAGSTHVTTNICNDIGSLCVVRASIVVEHHDSPHRKSG